MRRYRVEIINSVWLLSEKVVRFFLSFVVTLLIARYLFPAQFGIYSSFLAVIGMLAPITQMGLSGILIQRLVKAQNPQEQDSILQNACVLRFIGGVLLCFVVLLPALLLVERVYDYRFELTLLFIANACSCFSVYESYFKAVRKDKVNALIQAGILLISGILKIASLYVFTEVATLLTVLLVITGIELVAIPVVTYRIWRRCNVGETIRRVTWAGISDLWTHCRWLLLSGAAAVLYIKTDVVMVIWLMDDYAAGIYGAASRFTELWFFLAPLLMNVFLPKLQTLYQENNASFKRLIRWLSGCMSLFAFSIALLMVLLSDYLIDFALGEAFSASKQVLIWHVWLLPLVFFRAVISTWLIINEHYRFSLVSHAFGAVTNILLNLLLIPAFGLIGAVVASWCAFFVATFFAMGINARTRVFFRDLVAIRP